MRKIRATTLGAVLVFIALVGPVLAAGIPDHLKCYKIKDPLLLQGVLDVDTLQFGVDPGCTVSKAKLYCTPATKVVVSAVDKATGTPITPVPMFGAPTSDDRICYKLKCASLPADQQVTDQFGTRTLDLIKTSYVCTPAVVGGPPARFVDNGDGTVTDNQTGLMWEQKVDLGSLPTWCDDVVPDLATNTGDACWIHDVYNFHSWTETAGGTIPDGTAFTEFLGLLNNCVNVGSPPTGVVGGFAGHCDWRLPTIMELQTILQAPYPCGTNPCIDAIFGPTMSGYYWSSSTYAFYRLDTWVVRFNDGFMGNATKIVTYYVRAVRGGS